MHPKKLFLLARVIDECEDEMICDLAETYHLFNYQEYPPEMVGTLVFGLRKDSRVKMKLSGDKITTTEWLLARIADELRDQSWARSKDGEKGRNRPKHILDQLLGLNKREQYATFETMEEFERMWSEI